jgi:hypothetical protein
MFREAGRATVPLPEARKSMTVNRAIMEMSGQRQIAYFYPIHARHKVGNINCVGAHSGFRR